MYTSDNHGAMIPCYYTEGGYWWNILADNNYIKVPTVTGSDVSDQTIVKYNQSILFCPAGETALNWVPGGGGLGSNGSNPATRISGSADEGYREADGGGVGVDCWYGCNAGYGTQITSPGSPVYSNGGETVYDTSCQGPAMHYLSADTDVWLNQSAVHRSADMVMIYDGLIYHLYANGCRLAARHNGHKYTNILFFDGHVQTILTDDLPGTSKLGQNGASTTDDPVTGLPILSYTPPPSGNKSNSNLANYPWPIWYLEQQ
jgi:prepilin-type processing-associated H-X9-DG protein